MKKIFNRFLLIWIVLGLFGTITTVFADESPPKTNAFIEIEKSNESTVDVSLKILPQNDMHISSMVFSIGYTYSYGSDECQFSFNEGNNDKLILDNDFSGATVSNSHVYYDTFNYVWESSSPVHVSSGELITLATISLDISSSAKEGEYVFTLDSSEFYCFENDEDLSAGHFKDVIVEISQDGYYFWLGEKMEANTSRFSIVASGSQDIIDIVSVTKNVDVSQCYITDTSIAEIVEIQNFDAESGAFIYIVGRKVGTTTLIVKGGYQHLEELYVSIKVVEPTPYLLSVSNQPSKTIYSIGEDLDLSGLKLRVTYDNNDVEYITYSHDIAHKFTVGEYDFSTYGSKTINITYQNLSTTINVTVIDSDNPDIPSDVLRGDMNGDKLVTDADAIYLLYYTFFPNDYPLNQDGDYNSDEIITDADAIYLLYHTFFPSDYPL